MSWYLGAWTKYATFTGRARRTEYWMFFLFNVIMSLALVVADYMLGTANSNGNGLLGGIYSLAVLLPALAVAVRRMHDTDHSGWWILVPFFSFVLALTEGTRGSNRFGSDPKFAQASGVAASPAGWFPDPTGKHQFRYWDSAQWTSSVADNGVTVTDRVVDEGPVRPHIGVADEIAKFAAMRDQGILTNDEFELQKCKLLAGAEQGSTAAPDSFMPVGATGCAPDAGSPRLPSSLKPLLHEADRAYAGWIDQSEAFFSEGSEELEARIAVALETFTAGAIGAGVPKAQLESILRTRFERIAGQSFFERVLET